MRRLSTVAAVLTTAICLSAASGALADSVTGAGTTTWGHCPTFDPVTLTISATSGPAGETPAGSFTFTCTTGETFTGVVQCLHVFGTSGNLATIGGTVTSSNSPAFPVGTGLTFEVIDNSPDGISSLNAGVDCTIQDTGFHSLITGDITVVNTQPPPPPACSDGIDNDSDGKTDYPTDPGCTSATDTDETDPPPPAPTNKQQCMNNGWKNYPTLNFRNQGDCTNYVNKHSK